ncbi:MAG: DUF1592 domain-containing protein [Pirellulales bacterium]
MLVPSCGLLVLSVSYGLVTTSQAQLQTGQPASAAASPAYELVDRFLVGHCVDCHNRDDKTGGLSLEDLRIEQLSRHSLEWEKVVRKLRTRQMPPAEMPRPDEDSYRAVIANVESALDRAAVEDPTPGRTSTFRRLTRAEYQNAIGDLLSLKIDAERLLPTDESSHGFDNITVSGLSPTLLNRYLSAAQKISQLAVGRPQRSPDGGTIRIRPDVTQEERVEGLPLGTRGGVIFHHHFPQDGKYEFQIRLTRDRDEHVEGLSEPHTMELLLDRKRERLFEVKPPRAETAASDAYSAPSHAQVDIHLTARIAVAAGPHEIGATFLKYPSSLLESKRQPLNVHFNMNRHPRIGPAIYEVSITGPYEATGPGDTPSRRRIFGEQPTKAAASADEAAASEILSKLMRRAYRRPVQAEDLQRPMELFREATEQEGFDAGIELALSSVLVSPHFLFRIERAPEGVPPDTAYRISDLELASRLSFFLWSSIPDDELLDVAAQGQLADPDVLEQQTLRMLRDARSKALVTHFAGQWLHLRNLESSTPDMRLFPDFDDNLRQALRRETELFIKSVMREDRSVLDLLKADYTFLNERLAKHYGIPHVYGSRFRRVALDPQTHRGGLLRHGSILTVTSYATRTSPVIRGKWILDNVLGTPPPPPPPDIPALKDNTVLSTLSVRERLAAHRDNLACARCHDSIDPVGFALENFDAVGRWRELEEGQPIDASGGLPDGSQFAGVDGLEEGLLNRPEIFVSTLSEKLLTYALGRGVEHFDAPAVRQIVREASAQDYRFSSLILGIVKSTPFQMRTSE